MPWHQKLVVSIMAPSWLSAAFPQVPAPAAPCNAQQQHAVLQRCEWETAGHIWTLSMASSTRPQRDTPAGSLMPWVGCSLPVELQADLCLSTTSMAGLKVQSPVRTWHTCCMVKQTASGLSR